MTTAYPAGPPDDWPATAGPATPPVDRSAPRRRRTGLLAVAALAALVALVVAAVVLTADDEPTVAPPPTTPTTPSTEATPPDGPSAIDGGGPSTEPSLAWSSVLPELSFVSDLAADSERVYVTTSAADGRTLLLTTYDAADGAVLWQHGIDGIEGNRNVVPVGDDRVLVLTFVDAVSGTQLLDAVTGEVLWEAVGWPALAYAEVGSQGSAPIAEADPLLLEVYDDDDPIGVAAVDPGTGEVLWETSDMAARPCGEVVLLESGGVTSAGLVVAVRDARTGAELWDATSFATSCADGAVATTTSIEDVSLRDVRDGSPVGEVTFPAPAGGWPAIPPGSQPTGWSVIAVGDLLVGSTYDELSGAARTAVVERAGGQVRWEGAAVHDRAVGLDHVLLRSGDGAEVTLLRPAEGRTAGQATSSGPYGGGCPGIVTLVSILGCDGQAIAAWSLGDELVPAWTTEVDAGVDRMAVGGEVLFVIAAGRLLALR